MLVPYTGNQNVQTGTSLTRVLAPATDRARNAVKATVNELANTISIVVPVDRRKFHAVLAGLEQNLASQLFHSTSDRKGSILESDTDQQDEQLEAGFYPSDDQAVMVIKFDFICTMPFPDRSQFSRQQLSRTQQVAYDLHRYIKLAQLGVKRVDGEINRVSGGSEVNLLGSLLESASNQGQLVVAAASTQLNHRYGITGAVLVNVFAEATSVLISFMKGKVAEAKFLLTLPRSPSDPIIDEIINLSDKDEIINLSDKLDKLENSDQKS